MYIKSTKTLDFKIFIVLVLILLTVMACAHQGTVSEKNTALSISEVTTNNRNMNTDEAHSASYSSNSSSNLTGTVVADKIDFIPTKTDYVLGSEDLIEIDVYQVDELKRTVRISSSGYIKLPLAGKIMASGLTKAELEAEISTRLERYLQEPVISIFIREYRSQRITVIGAVNRPQVHIVSQQKFLLDMISLSEGLTGDAGDICYVQRGHETIVVNINDLLINGKTHLNIPVFAGDTIHVPKGGIVFVDGSVNAPGSFVMKGTMTITQVIAMAQGLQYEAKRSNLKIYRDTGSEAREIIDVDYDDILSQKTEDIVLKNKDVVIVPGSGAKKFYQGFVSTLGGLIRFGKVSVGAGAL